MDIRSVTVWFGGFPTEDDLRAYLEETFAEDMGEPALDPDFAKWSWRDEPTADAIALLADHTGAPAYAEAAAAQWGHGFPANAVVLVFGDRVATPRSVLGSDHELQLIGRFGEPPN